VRDNEGGEEEDDEEEEEFEGFEEGRTRTTTRTD
jgi:hypothetical protein